MEKRRRGNKGEKEDKDLRRREKERKERERKRGNKEDEVNLKFSANRSVCWFSSRRSRHKLELYGTPFHIPLFHHTQMCCVQHHADGDPSSPHILSHLT
jgi:hypothetical protein